MCATGAKRKKRKRKIFVQCVYAHIRGQQMSDDTSIRIKVGTWRQLRERKGPGESFDDVINGILDEAESDAPQEQPAEG